MSSWTGPVVVEAGGSADESRLVDYASREALRAGAELTLVTPNRGSSATAEAVLRAAAAQVERRYGEQLAIKVLALEGSRQNVLQEAAHDARLLVVGRGPRGGAAGLDAAEGDLELARRLGSPLMVVPTGWRPSAVDRSVLVGIDGTQLSLEAVEFAFRAAADRQGDLTVVHSYRMPYRDHAAADEWTQHAGLTVSETLAGWDEEYPHVEVTRFLTTAPVVDTLARESHAVGLVVVGAHAGPRLIADPVACGAIARTACPIAVVPHHTTFTARDEWRRGITAGRSLVSEG